MDGFKAIMQEGTYCQIKGIHIKLPISYLKRDDIFLSCQAVSNDKDQPQLFVYASFEGESTDYMVLSEQFYGNFSADGDILANAIINQIQDNEEMMDEIKKLIEFLKK